MKLVRGVPLLLERHVHVRGYVSVPLYKHKTNSMVQTIATLIDETLMVMGAHLHVRMTDEEKAYLDAHFETPTRGAGRAKARTERFDFQTEKAFSLPKKSRATRVRLFGLQFFRQKLLLHAALLAALAHALETDGAVHQSKQGIIAALADILTRLDVSAALTNEDVAGQNELTVCTLGAQTLCCGIAAVLGAAYALFMCHCNLPP